MSRPLRLELSGGLYHVTSRGDRREDIFVDDIDREVWLETLAQCCERYNWTIHAWQRRQGEALPFACFVRTDEPLNPVMSRGGKRQGLTPMNARSLK